MAPELLPPVFALWRELERISAADLDGGSRLVGERLGALIDAQRSYTLVGAVDRGTWSPLRRLPGLVEARGSAREQNSEREARRVDTRFCSRADPRASTFRSRADPRASTAAAPDAYVAGLVAGAGAVRVVCVREQEGREPSAGFEGPEDRMVDCLCLVLPVGPKAEVAFAFERRGGAPRFSGKDREVALLCAPGLSRTARWVVLAYGDSVGGPPLGDRERKVLASLLSGATEKEAAALLGTTLGALHQIVVGIYRKLGVRSRPELMALWCGDLAGGSIGIEAGGSAREQNVEARGSAREQNNKEEALAWKGVHYYRMTPLAK